MAERAAYSITDRETGRTIEGEAASAVLIVDGQPYCAATPEEGYDAWVALGGLLVEHMPRSAKWQAVCVGLRHAQAASSLDRRRQADARAITSASDMLEIVRAELGEDAWARVRKAAADRLLGRG